MLPFPIISNLRQKSSTTVTKFIAGISHIAALGSNGQLFTRGSNQYGQLGNTSFPTDYNNWILSLDNVSSVYGDRSNCLVAIKNDGTVWVCGQFNYTSQFGFVGGTGAHSWIEMTTAIPFSTSLIKEIVVANGCSFIIRSDGLLYCCGLNTSGLFGNNNTVTPTTYTQSSSASDVQKIYVPHATTTANVMYYIDSNNHVFAAGNNSARQTNNTTSVSQQLTFLQMSTTAMNPNAIAVAGSTSWVTNSSNTGLYCGSGLTLQNVNSGNLFLYAATSNGSSNITEMQLGSYSAVYARKTDGKFYAKEYYSGGGSVTPLINNSTDRTQWTFQHNLPTSNGIYSSMAIGNFNNAFLLFFGNDLSQEVYGLGLMFPQNDSVYRLLTLPSFA